MHLLLSAALLLQQAVVSPAAADSDSLRAARHDSLMAAEALRDSLHHARLRAMRAVAVTPAMEASAYQNAAARTLIGRAREARFEQDSSLRYYDAISRERITAKLGLRAAGPDRLLFRSENASRVQWQRGRGARVTLMGARTAFPMMYRGTRVLIDFLEMDPIPYYPGREGLLTLGGVNVATRTTEEGLFIHPLDRGAEMFYTFEATDSIRFRLPDGTTVRLRAVRVAARKPAQDLIVGVLWFDEASGQLVRGVFRPTVPYDIRKFVEEDDSTAFQDVPALVKPLIFPMEMTISAFTVEYGLHEERWWLPRNESVEARVRMGVMYASGAAERSFTYSVVNSRDTIPRIFASAEDSLRHTPGDTLFKARMHEEREQEAAARRAARDSARKRGGRTASAGGPDDDNGMPSFHCSGTDTTIARRMRYEHTVPVQIIVPCDTVALLNSPELPPTIYDPGEATFGLRERDELAQELTMGIQAGWDPQPVTWHYGIENSLIRYNRVDALDAGVQVSRVFGSGYSGDLTARVSVGGPEFYGEGHFRRSDGWRTYDFGVYRRLTSANDWGDPLSVGASLNVLILGTDQGFYYNAWGAELRSVTQTQTRFTWRLFAEQQSDAPVTTQFSLPNVITGKTFTPNVVTPLSNAAGAQVRFRDEVGLDPHGWRTSYDARAEGGGVRYLVGDSVRAYGRVALDGTVSHGLGRYLDMQIGAGAGTSFGVLPPQRDWFLGGAWTIRGQRPGAAIGDAYWMGHAELGSSFVAVRPTLFFDIGWAGAREDWRHPGVPVSGAGVGVSFLDGLIKVDLAHGINPTSGLVLDVSTGARF